MELRVANLRCRRCLGVPGHVLSGSKSGSGTQRHAFADGEGKGDTYDRSRSSIRRSPPMQGERHGSSPSTQPIEGLVTIPLWNRLVKWPGNEGTHTDTTT